jgi:Uma2 family endonuclease
MTLQEWAELPEDVPGELVDGRLVEEEMPDYVHEVVVAWLVRILGNWAESSGAIVGGSDAKFAVSGTQGRKADATVFLADRRPPRRGLVTIPPDIMIEVITPRPRDEQRDRVIKVEEYARFAVRWYWIVDPERRTFQVLELRPHGKYESVIEQGGGTVHGVPGCPGLDLDLDAMWAKADELTE